MGILINGNHADSPTYAHKLWKENRDAQCLFNENERIFYEIIIFDKESPSLEKHAEETYRRGRTTQAESTISGLQVILG